MPFAPPAPDTAEAPAFTPPPLASAETEGGFTPPTLESVEGLDLSVPFAGESAAELRRRDQTQVANNHDLRDVLGNTWGVVNTPIIDVHPGGGMVLGHEFKDEETLKYIQEMMQHGSVEEAIGLGLRAGDLFYPPFFG